MKDNIGNNMIYVKRIGLLGALAVGLMLTLAACGGTDNSGLPAVTATDTPAITVPATDTPATDMTSEAATPTQAAMQSDVTVTPTPASATGQSSGTVTEVKGELMEWGINLSQKEVPAGKVRFTVTNSGMMAHNFTVLDSSGSPLAGTPNFRGADGAQTFDVDLQPGTYTIICTLPGHAARGQMTQIVVK